MGFPNACRVRGPWVHLNELGNIGTGGQRNPDRGRPALLGVEKEQPLPHFPGGIANHCVGVRVVVMGAIEDLNAQRALFQQVRFVRERVFHDEPEQSGVAFAVAKVRTGENRFQLREDRFPVLFGLRSPYFVNGMSTLHRCFASYSPLPALAITFDTRQMPAVTQRFQRGS